MNYLDKINEIIRALANNNELDVSKEIEELKLSASTSTELLMSITFKLKQLIENNNEISKLIEKDVLELLNYCRSIGLNIK